MESGFLIPNVHLKSHFINSGMIAIGVFCNKVENGSNRKVEKRDNST